MPNPVGELKKIVSLVDRSAFDDTVYPSDAASTKFQPVHKPYHEYASEITVMPFTGSPEWGKRITFSMPWPWQGDFLNWIALRLKPLPWMDKSILNHLIPNYGLGDWTLLNSPPPYDDYNKFFVWANSLGTTAIALAEMEVDGVIVEQFSGDWASVWNRTFHSVTNAVPWDDALYAVQPRNQTPTVNNLLPTEDGYIYCYLPFWFSRWVNTAFPLCATRGPNTVRFHITLRPLSEVVRKIGYPLTCKETPLNRTYEYQELNQNFNSFKTSGATPGFEAADIIASVTHVATPLRDAYVNKPNELMMTPVLETTFAEPLKYVANKGATDLIYVQLPLIANGPLRQIIFFLRRNAAIEQYNDRNNFSATLNPDIVWNPEQPLLRRASLQVGTAVWADEDEKWWRTKGNLAVPGGVRGYADYIYAYNFADKPAEFDPSGSVNASRVDLRLNLTVAPPGGVSDGEWSVTVFYVGTNWMRFQNSIANPVFSD
jgi:hypothetical protein